MSASLATISARTPVSSRTSRSAVCSGFSPSSMAPLGSATSSASVGVRLDLRSLRLRRGRSMCGSITAKYQRPRILRKTTPPAENSRTIGIREERVVSQQVQSKATTDFEADFEGWLRVRLSFYGIHKTHPSKTSLGGALGNRLA